MFWHKLFSCAVLMIVGIRTIGSQAIRAEDYLPLEAGAKYEYRGAFKDKVDTSTYIVKGAKAKSGTWFYFIDDLQLVTGCFPWPGALSKRSDGVVGVQASWVDQMEHITADRQQLLLKLPLRKGDETGSSLYDGSVKCTTTVLGFESVVVPAGRFESCAKIRMRTTYSAEAVVHNEFFWLAPGVGLVKWVRATGRVDELTRYSRPRQ